MVFASQKQIYQSSKQLPKIGKFQTGLVYYLPFFSGALAAAFAGAFAPAAAGAAAAALAAAAVAAVAAVAASCAFNAGFHPLLWSGEQLSFLLAILT